MAENGGFCITAGVVGRQKLVSAQVVEVPQGAPCAVVAAIAHHLCVMTNSVGLERDYRTGAKLGGSPDVVARPHAEEKDSGPSGRKRRRRPYAHNGGSEAGSHSNSSA